MSSERTRWIGDGAYSQSIVPFLTTSFCDMRGKEMEPPEAKRPRGRGLAAVLAVSLCLAFLSLPVAAAPRLTSLTEAGPPLSRLDSYSASSAPPPEPPSGRGGEADDGQQPSGYDAHPSMFSPNGRLLQIEYAMTAVHHGKPIIGIRTNEGVVLAGRKTIESKKLQDSRLGQKIYQVDLHILVAVTGVVADALALVRLARSYAQDYRKTYGEPIPVRHLVERICDVKHICTMVPRRPFGVSMLFAGWDPIRGHQLYQTDPSANFGSWLAVAVGDKHEVLTSRLVEALVPVSSKSLEGIQGLAVSIGDACGLACKLLAVDDGEREGGEKQARAIELAAVTKDRSEIMREQDVRIALGLQVGDEEEDGDHRDRRRPPGGFSEEGEE